jgi:hypothetical protein
MPRIKGTPNRLTSEIKQRISDALNSTIENLDKDLNDLPTKERLEIFTRLLPYILPKLKETDINLVNDNQNPNEIKVHIIKSE